MDKIREKMDEIRSKIHEAEEEAERFSMENKEASRKLLQNELAVEELRRRKQSILARVEVAEEHLQNANEKLQWVSEKNEDQIQRVEVFETRGELHDIRIGDLQLAIQDAKTKYDEKSSLLEEARRKVEVLRSQITRAKKRREERERKFMELQHMLQSNDRKTNEIEAKTRENIDKEYSFEVSIDTLREKIQMKNNHVDMAERLIPSLQHQIEVTKQEINRTKVETGELKKQLQDATEEIHELTMI